MRVMEVPDIGFTVARHAAGGHKVARFGNEAAFLYGREGIVPIRQRGSKARMAFVTLWGCSPGGDYSGDEIDLVTVKEVQSLRVQAHLRALKRHGWAPLGDKGAADLSKSKGYSEPLEVVAQAAGWLTHKVNLPGVWAPKWSAAPIRRRRGEDTVEAVATAVIMAVDDHRKALLEEIAANSGYPTGGDPYEEFAARLGVIVAP